MQIRPYLTFNGNCSEAVELYKEAFQSEVMGLMRFKDVPQNPEHPVTIPDEQKEWVMQATIKFGDNFMRLSDAFGAVNAVPSDLVAISIESTVEEAKYAFEVLSKEGTVHMAPNATFFSPYYTSLTDKFGIKWEIAAALNQ